MTLYVRLGAEIANHCKTSQTVKLINEVLGRTISNGLGELSSSTTIISITTGNQNQIIHLDSLNINIQVYHSLSYPYVWILDQSLPIWIYSWGFLYNSHIRTIYSGNHLNNQRKSTQP